MTASFIVHPDPEDDDVGQGDKNERRECGVLDDFSDSLSNLFLAFCFPVEGDVDLLSIRHGDFIQLQGDHARLAIPASTPDGADSAVNRQSGWKDRRPLDGKRKKNLQRNIIANL